MKGTLGRRVGQSAGDDDLFPKIWDIAENRAYPTFVTELKKKISDFNEELLLFISEITNLKFLIDKEIKLMEQGW